MQERPVADKHKPSDKESATTVEYQEPTREVFELNGCRGTQQKREFRANSTFKGKT